MGKRPQGASMNQLNQSQANVSIGKQWTLLDGDRTLAVGETWEQLEQALSTVPQKAYSPNTIVDLVSSQGDTLSIGVAGSSDRDNPELAAPLACLNYMGASCNPPYLTVIGDPSLSYENGGVVIFRYEEGTWTEILRRNCVPVDVMLRIAKHFFLTGSLPDWIAWEEV
jgi:hypothetical protein